MQIGDLVVRWWHDKPMWDMVGIIIEKRQSEMQRERPDRFIVYWTNQPVRKDALWSDKEIRKISEVR